MPVNTSCFYSTFKNVSGMRRHFSFLGSHGVTLIDNEEYTQFGAPEHIVQKDSERVTSRRHMHAFEMAIERGDLEVVKTPAPILEDTATGDNMQLKMTSGALGVAVPCWRGTSPTDLEPF